MALGRHGEMRWLEDKAERRRHPNALWPEARGIVALGLNYGPETDPLDVLAATDRAAISVYAPGRDYHLVVKIGRAHVLTPVTNAHIVCRLLLETNKHMRLYPLHMAEQAVYH